MNGCNTPDDTGDDLDQGAMRERRTSGRATRRRAAGSRVTTIYWRDIPAQLTARVGDRQHKVLLHARFQHAIDRAAGVAGLTSTNDYVQEWRSVGSPLPDGDISAQLDQLCAELEAAYPRDRLEGIVAAGGVDQPNEQPPGISETDSPATTEEAS
ncbi:MAG: hypothetical protein HKN44_02900 [Ilumatobacter sp.]|nr:hypothetical protein [Ilumatobacter sp.]